MMGTIDADLLEELEGGRVIVAFGQPVSSEVFEDVVVPP
jgi:hypothetical protein